MCDKQPQRMITNHTSMARALPPVLRMGVIPVNPVIGEVFELKELVLPSKCTFLPATNFVACGEGVLTVVFGLNPELNVTLPQDFHHEWVNLFFAEVLLVSDYRMGGKRCGVMRPQDLFGNVGESHLVWIWKVLIVELKQMVGVLICPQSLSSVILIEFLSFAGVEESVVKLLDQLKTGSLRLAEVRVVPTEGDNELFPHTGELAPSGDDFPIELRKEL